MILLTKFKGFCSMSINVWIKTVNFAIENDFVNGVVINVNGGLTI